MIPSCEVAKLFVWENGFNWVLFPLELCATPEEVKGDVRAFQHM